MDADGLYLLQRRRMGEREKPGEKDGDVLLHKWEGRGGLEVK